MYLYPASDHLVVLAHRQSRRLAVTLDEIFAADSPYDFVARAFADAPLFPLPERPGKLIQSQELWGAGVTYLRSMSARKEESKDSGGDTFYDRVYSAERPELFFKATAHRVVAPLGAVHIRTDSRWNVPEPELTLALNRHGRIFGYTIGNDMSSRDIEGENPLYLPQAKVFDRCASLGPALWISDRPPGPRTAIELKISRNGQQIFREATAIGQMKRSLSSLAEYLLRDNSFPHGCFLMTGTGIVPPTDFTLQAGDQIGITIEPIGTLVNYVD